MLVIRSPAAIAVPAIISAPADRASSRFMGIFPPLWLCLHR